jgi:hypothetical protein
MVIRAGIRPTRTFDGHKHFVHVLPGVCGIVIAALRREFPQHPGVRCP